MNDYIKKGETYLEKCVFDGLAHSWDVDKREYVKAYPEVTGYIIDYFCNYCDSVPVSVIKAADYLVDIQDSTGGYSSFCEPNILYVFDTAQIMKGLCSLYERKHDDRYLEAAIKAAIFILKSQESVGCFKPIFNLKSNAWIIRDETYSLWNGPFSGLMCKVVEALIKINRLLDDKRYLNAIQRAGDFYKKVSPITHTHPLGYWLEGLLSCGEDELVKNIIETRVLDRIESNGFISYSGAESYAYVSGVIQIGIVLLKMGYTDEARIIREYGRMVQKKSDTGGLFQYADRNGDLNRDIHSEINSWGTKYFCELERMIESV